MFFHTIFFQILDYKFKIIYTMKVIQSPSNFLFSCYFIKFLLTNTININNFLIKVTLPPYQVLEPQLYNNSIITDA